MNGIVEINRYVLRPNGPSDAKQLLDRCGLHAVYPLDEFLEISDLPFKMTPEVMLKVAYWAARSPSYEEASRSLFDAYGMTISDDRIRKVTNYVGQMVFDEDRKRAEEAYSRFIQGKWQFPNEKRRGVLYIETDGSMINTRAIDACGSSWRENKLGEIFSSDNIHKWTNKKTGKSQHRILKREYVGYAGSVSEFKKHLLACAIRNGYGLYEQVVLLADGADWIRNVREELFPDAIQILDYFHLCENVNTYAKHLLGTDENLYRPWADKMCEYLKLGQHEDVLAELGKRARPTSCPIDLPGYISKNADCIDYPTYERSGFFIGSGAIESGNKNVIQQRLKQSGMRWNIETAQQLITLRTKYKSNLWAQDVSSLVRNRFKDNRSRKQALDSMSE